MYDFLKKVPLFADLDKESLDQLCQMVEEVRLPAGAELFAEGSAGDRAYVVKEGEVEVLKMSSGREVLLAVHRSGGVIGEMALLEDKPRIASVRARQPTTLLSIGQEQLDHLLNTSPTAARVMLQTLIGRWRSTESIVHQGEKMAQLGTLTAGVSHELNNPAAAVRSGAAQLTNTIAQWQAANLRLSEQTFTASQLAVLQQLDALARARSAEPVDLDPIARADCETDLEDWLEAEGVENSWELAPILVTYSCRPADMAALIEPFDERQRATVLAWFSTILTIYMLLAEIGQGASRIADIVNALKAYAYLDQAPVQAVDIHEGLDNTLIMLRSKLKPGLTVRRSYALDLPLIQAYGSELNQVWTNILDNAIDAMNGRGEIEIRTRREEQWVVVEIEDQGPGIPEAIQARIFDPFFTTKAPGKGTGLGLNISYNSIVNQHRGQIHLSSRPGKTIFQVRLPLKLDDKDGAKAPVPLLGGSDEETMRRILETTRTVAVVGISARSDRPAYSVSAYLQAHGYRIVPVNPGLTAVLGEKAYPDLATVPEAVDTVLIFRHTEAVSAVVDAAIQIGARYIWMQEGVVNESAALAAQSAGLEVVMDNCMRASHRRLMSVK